MLQAFAGICIFAERIKITPPYYLQNKLTPRLGKGGGFDTMYLALSPLKQKQSAERQRNLELVYCAKSNLIWWTVSWQITKKTHEYSETDYANLEQPYDDSDRNKPAQLKSKNDRFSKAIITFHTMPYFTQTLRDHAYRARRSTGTVL